MEPSPENPSSSENLPSPTILLVEDDLSHAELITRAIRESGIVAQVRQAGDGQSALDYLFRRGPFADPATSPRPRLVLLDLRLPRIDGLDVLRQIKASPNLRQTPVVVLTTAGAKKEIAAAYALHANGIVMKPVDFSSIVGLMSDSLSYWLYWNRDPWGK